jgi:hypothetical protein
MQTLALIEIILGLIWVLVFIAGIILVNKEKKLSVSSKLVWIILLIVFNFFALIAFLILRKKL